MAKNNAPKPTKVFGIIGRTRNGYWQVRTMDEWDFQDERHFIFSEGAFEHWRKFETAAYYRIKSRLLFAHLDIDRLDTKERAFVSRMHKNNWRGCTKKQYCYLVGIQERNPK